METRTSRNATPKKKIIFAVFMIIVLLVIMFTTLYFNHNDTSVYHDSDAETALNEYNTHNVEIDWDESRYQQVLHEMMHQKVIARSKIGAVEMTKSNIKAMIGIAKEHKYKFNSFYLDILRRWQNNDFSDVSGEHNQIRGYQTDIPDDTYSVSNASQSQEQNFISEVFKY